MKIAFVAPFPERGGAPRGGVESVVQQLVAYCVGQGHECHVIAVNSSKQAVESDMNVVVHRIRRSRIPGAFHFWAVMPQKLRAIVRNIKPDIVHVHGAASWAVGMPCPTILTIHGVTEREIAYRHPLVGSLIFSSIRMLEQRALARVRNLILINDYVRELRKISDRQSYWEIPNPIDRRFYEIPSPANLPRGARPQLVWVGNDGRRKNLDLLIRIVAAFEPEDAPDVHVFGVDGRDETTYVTECRRKIARFRLQQRFIFRGRVPQSSIISCMDESSALILTSLQETAPCVISEALARGLYVFAPRGFGVPGMLPSEDAGWMFGLEEPTAQVAATMANLLRSKASSNREERKALALKYHPDRVGAETLATYEQICFE